MVIATAVPVSAKAANSVVVVAAASDVFETMSFIVGCVVITAVVFGVTDVVVVDAAAAAVTT